CCSSSLSLLSLSVSSIKYQAWNYFGFGGTLNNVGKNPHAVALGRRGGKRRAEVLSKDDRQKGWRDFYGEPDPRGKGSIRAHGWPSWREAPCPCPHERAAPRDRPQSRRSPVGQEAVTKKTGRGWHGGLFSLFFFRGFRLYLISKFFVVRGVRRVAVLLPVRLLARR